MQATNELRVLVEAETDRAIAALRKTDEQLGKTEKKALGLGEAIDKLERPAKSLPLSFAASAAAALKFASDTESTRKSLEVLLKSEKAAIAMQREWTQFASSTPLETDEIERSGKALLAFGVSAAEVTESMRRIGDVASGTGTSLSELAGIYGKAKVQGRLFAEDINQFTGRGIPVARELAKVMGVSESAVKDLVAEGKIGFPELEAAFVSMTEPGGQFAGMMEELSQTAAGKFSSALDNAKLALAGFGEVLLPAVNSMLDSASGIFDAIGNLDSGTKRFILTFGGVVAISGPVIAAVKGMGAAFALLAANPVILAVTGAVAAVALAAAAINKYNHQLEDSIDKISETSSAADSLISSYAGLNGEQALNSETVNELIRLYPELTGKIHSYVTTADEAKAAVNELTKAHAEEAIAGQLVHLKRMQEQLKQERALYDGLKEQWAKGNHKYLSQFHAGEIDFDQYQEYMALFENSLVQGSSFGSLESLQKNIASVESQFKESLANLNQELAKAGYELTSSLELIGLPAPEVDAPAIPEAVGAALEAETDSTIKTWQQWWEKTTGVDEELFGSSGKKAGELFVASLEEGLSGQETLTALLGEKFNLAGALKAQQEDIQKTIEELLAIGPAQIDEVFTLSGTDGKADSSLQVLIGRYRELGETVRQLNFEEKLAEINGETQKLTKSERELAVAASLAAGYTEEQAEALADANAQYAVASILDEYQERVDNLGLSQAELARDTLIANGATAEQIALFDELAKKLEPEEDGEGDDGEGKKKKEKKPTTLAGLVKMEVFEALEAWGKFDAEVNETLASLAEAAIPPLSTSIIAGYDEIGKALANGEGAATGLNNALTAMSMQLLETLPTLLLEAGLMLILQGQWALGLGLVLASAAIGITSAFVNEKASANATGGVYDPGGHVAFAKGGAFTNSIVNRPTLFPFAHGTGLMGEAGPEAIMPLTRTAGGDLGVRAEGLGGGSFELQVIINNYSSEEVSAEEKTGDNGQRQLEITIGAMINQHITNGRADKAMKGRYGIGAKGV